MKFFNWSLILRMYKKELRDTFGVLNSVQCNTFPRSFKLMLSSSN